MAYIRCWTCNGSGAVKHTGCPIELCPDCRGTGCDEKKTRETKTMGEWDR